MSLRNGTVPDRTDFLLGDFVATDQQWSAPGELHKVIRRNAKSLTVETPSYTVATVPYGNVIDHFREVI